MIRLLSVGLTVLVFVLPSSPPVAARADEPLGKVQELLDVRSKAVADGDKQSFMRTVDPDAPQQFKDRQSVMFDGMRTIPLQQLRYAVRLNSSGDLAAGLELRAKYKADRAYMPETRQYFRIDQYDDRDDINSQWLTYVERNGIWYVAADDDARIIGLDTEHEIWDLGPMSVFKTEHFLVLTRDSDRSRSEQLGGIAEQAMARFQEQWQHAWHQRVPLLVVSSEAEVRAVLDTKADIANFSAFTVYTPYREQGVWFTTAPRLYAQESNLAGTSVARQVNTMVHELTHAASASFSGPFTPTWLHEGLAEWTKAGRPRSSSPPSQMRIPSSDDFTSGDSSRLGDAYELSTSLVSYLSARNEAFPWRLFDEVGAIRDVAGSSSYNLNKAFVSVTGHDVQTIEADWKRQYGK